MPHYKDQQGKLHFLESADFDSLLPEGCVKISDAEAEALQQTHVAQTEQTRFTSLEFLDRFTNAEQLAVVEATMQSAPVKLWYDRLLAASYVDLADPRTEDGVDALIAAGLIEASRKAAILQPGGV